MAQTGQESCNVGPAGLDVHLRGTDYQTQIWRLKIRYICIMTEYYCTIQVIEGQNHISSSKKL